MKEARMKRIVIPVDGSSASLEAVRLAAREAPLEPVQLELVNVQPRLNRHIASHLTRGCRDAWRRDRAAAALSEARRLARASHMDFATHVRCGPVVPSVLAAARELGADEILIGAPRRGMLASWLANSFSARLVAASPIPVRVVSTGRAPWAGRIAWPAGLGILLVWLLVE
jgi:nucleotide-binding universal stress UspA family protein